MEPSSKFTRRFEGNEALDALLGLAGSTVTAEEVVKAFRSAQQKRLSPADVIPSFFRGEPRFSDPSLAQKLYGNLLGLWDVLERAGTEPSRHLPTRPPPYGPEGPSSEYVELAWLYLQDIDQRARNRLEHSFENKQDGIVHFIENAGLPDRAFIHVRYLVFELATMIELGWPGGVHSAKPDDLLKAEPLDFPAALGQYADEAIFEAEQDDAEPLSAEESRRARDVVNRCAGALWHARCEGR